MKSIRSLDYQCLSKGGQEGFDIHVDEFLGLGRFYEGHDLHLPHAVRAGQRIDLKDSLDEHLPVACLSADRADRCRTDRADRWPRCGCSGLEVGLQSGLGFRVRRIVRPRPSYAYPGPCDNLSQPSYPRAI